MPVEMRGRRIPVQPGVAPYDLLKEPGDYCGPDDGSWCGAVSVYFLLPIARDENAQGLARALHHVCSPPHTFREEPDGTLTIRNSIGAGSKPNYYWHGFLNEGCWELKHRKTLTGD
jgi:hypothetical protein